MIARRIFASVAAACLVFLMSDRALALWLVTSVSPEEAKAAGFDVTAESTDSTTTILISRRLPDEGTRGSDSAVTRGSFAKVEVVDEAGVAVGRGVAPQREGEFVKYRVTLARKRLPRATFSIYEWSRPDPSQVHIIDPRLTGGAKVMLIGGDVRFLDHAATLLFGKKAPSGANQTDSKEKAPDKELEIPDSPAGFLFGAKKASGASQADSKWKAPDKELEIGWERVIYQFDLNEFVSK